ncbi:hypothetical protein SSX86_024038 [Deinandra increscens subsp. villosa]|uniref:Alpha/beta hydrolase fold-3 domain-containing protein n=1 Tax=Deinandra increscens subsp. villosa TaxID=3103831 RepID=A0AAP0CIJ9_9ASTR
MSKRHEVNDDEYHSQPTAKSSKWVLKNEGQQKKSGEGSSVRQEAVEEEVVEEKTNPPRWLFPNKNSNKWSENIHRGVVLLHPYFWGKDRVGSESDDQPWIVTIDDIWMFVHPETSGLDDPLINPGKDPNVSDLGCSRVLIFVAEKDVLRDRGLYYKDTTEKLFVYYNR